MVKIRFTSIKPGLVFEHEGVKLKAVEVEEANKYRCTNCFFQYYENLESCENYPCLNGAPLDPEQKHNLIFKKVEND